MPTSARKGPKFYAVRVGATPGVYHTYDDCLAQVKGHKGAIFKSFLSLTEAEAFVKSNGGPVKATGKPPKWYAVHSGLQPGVYTTWEECKEQITGAKKPVYKAFTSREDAQDFVQNGSAPQTPAAGEVGNGDIVIAPTTTKRKNDDSKQKVPPAKKQKKATGYMVTEEEELDETAHEPGHGPLPNGAEDGFDPRLMLAPDAADSGYISYKTPAQREAYKMQPVGVNLSACVDIYTDGCCKSNGVEGKAIAGWGVYFGMPIGKSFKGPVPGRQTNQRAELIAISRAFDVAPRDQAVRIITDSRYSISCITDWSKRWKINDWKTSQGKAVENRELIEGIVKQVNERAERGVETRFLWTKGHAGNEGNEAADRLAVAGSGMDRSVPYVTPLYGIDETSYAEGMLEEDFADLPSPVFSESGNDQAPNVYNELLQEATVDEPETTRTTFTTTNEDMTERYREGTEEL